uniref:3-hydroxyacyl-CoA dehydrogenase n=1 Tax=Sphingomonas sp. JE1 TaxID=1628059 RepID=A0A0D4ZZE7_9SPHN|nr:MULTISPECIES: SDR family NAD(P)-dependent oxidoreductase [unclassified Sphingomonas]AJW29529.1 3-hydroxyacyl-CoA dehydrogenase [Sphingomonas sp. JE1]
MKMEGVAAIVTGGASGLGAATARRLAQLGAKVTLVDLNEALGQEVADEIGGRFAAANVADETDVAAALDAGEAAHGVARVLVNCAGIGKSIRTVDREGQPMPLDIFRRIVEVNLVGTYTMISRFAARLMALDPIGEERGVIINTASVAAYEGQIGQAAYAASKSGIVGMTLPVARDLAQPGIRVMTIAPGLFLTPLMQGMPAPALEALGKQVPFPSRLGQPDEYATLAVSIIDNPMLNGETIRLDGAIRMGPR